ncbi:MAG: DUF6687 family protein [Gammaproteobacteria bacterium]
MRFIPYAEAREQPNIVVDGAPLPSSLLTLSHWPNNQSPAAVRRDTSTATVFAWLDCPDLQIAAPFVTNNHFDEDGLFSVFALTEPQQALAMRELLIAASFAGDFGVVRRRDAARLCFILEALTDPASSTLPAAVFAAPDRVVALYEAMLPLLPTIVDDLQSGSPRFAALWAAQDEHLQQSEALLADGSVTIEELPDIDLAIVHVPPQLEPRPVRRYLEDEQAAVHPFAVNSATSCSRLLRVQGRHYEFEYRYESWLQIASRRVPLRVRLEGAVDALNALDAGAPAWAADEPMTGIVPRLRRSDGSPSTLGLDTVLAELRRAFNSAPIAWDPYDWTKPGPA